MTHLRQLYYSDNLPVLRQMPDESVDLIYLDPPFNSNRAYNIIYPNDMGQVTAFEDTWHWTPQCDEYLKTMASEKLLDAHSILTALISALGKVQMNAYLVNMAIRLLEMRRILKSSGTIYLHCDPTASHYLKIIMDQIFGANNFRNEIIWCYRGGGVPKLDFARKHDVLLRYSKTDKRIFNVDSVRIPYSDESEERLKYKAQSFRPNKVYDNYEKNPEGKHPEDWWEMQPIMPSSKERLGYPTQKPLKLLQRIVEASSNIDDIVLDPFCGCGTTIAASEVLKRQWIGIDITYSAIGAIKQRFIRQKLDIWGEIEILGEPKTIAEIENKLLNKSSPLYARKEFEKYCVSTIGGLPNQKMGQDGGIDGRIPFGNDEIAIVSVKSGHVTISDIRALKGLLTERNKIGIFVTKKEPTKGMIETANQAGIYEPDEETLDITRKNVPVIQILTLDELLQGKQPELP